MDVVRSDPVGNVDVGTGVNGPLVGLIPIVSTQSSGFRLQLTQVFLTYAQLSDDFTREVVMKNARAFVHKGKAVVSAVVAIEKHADGGRHTHVYLKFSGQLRTRRVNVFDQIGGKHPNIAKVTYLAGLLRYITKEDTTFMEHGICVADVLAAELRHTTPAAMRMASAIKEAKGDFGIVEAYEVCPMTALRLYPKIQLVSKDWRQEEMKELCAAKKWKELCMPEVRSDGSTNAVRRIVKWLNKNFGHPRVFKQAQLWVHGPANVGKTTLLRELGKLVSLYEITREKWNDGYYNGVFNGYYIDEFKRSLNASWMKRFYQNGRMTLTKRHTGPYIRSEASIQEAGIVVSNWSIEKQYRDSDLRCHRDNYESVKARFIQVEVKAGEFCWPTEWLSTGPEFAAPQVTLEESQGMDVTPVGPDGSLEIEEIMAEIGHLDSDPGRILGIDVEDVPYQPWQDLTIFDMKAFGRSYGGDKMVR